METIASFTIDHNRLLRGIYVSRKDQVGGETVTTFDIRMKEPNREPVLHPGALHTIEHLAATYLSYFSRLKFRYCNGVIWKVLLNVRLKCSTFW